MLAQAVILAQNTADSLAVLHDQTDEFGSDFFQITTSISDVFTVKVSDFLELDKGLIRLALCACAQ